MARIKTNTHEVLTNFCGNCGIILGKYLDIGDHCPKCKEVIEPWNAMVEDMHNTNFLSLIVMREEMHVVHFAKYISKINKSGTRGF